MGFNSGFKGLKRKVVIFSIECFLSIFGLGLIFESSEEVISSGEVSKEIQNSACIMKVLLR